MQSASARIGEPVASRSCGDMALAFCAEDVGSDLTGVGRDGDSVSRGVLAGRVGGVTAVLATGSDSDRSNNLAVSDFGVLEAVRVSCTSLLHADAVVFTFADDAPDVGMAGVRLARRMSL